MLLYSLNYQRVISIRQRFPDWIVQNEVNYSVLGSHNEHWLTGYKQDKKTGAWSPTLDEVVAGLRQSKADGLGTQGNREIVTDSFIAKLTVYRNPMRKRGI